MKARWSADEQISEWRADSESGWGGVCEPVGHLRGEEFEQAWAPVVSNALDTVLTDIDMLRSLVESPIEELFLAAAWARNGWFGLNRRLIRDGLPVVEVNDPSLPERLLIEPQAKVGKYACDFLLTLEWLAPTPPLRVSVGVEMDGHDFHEKTKAQAAHDKKRDRFFASEGLTVLRFTGSEVTRNAVSCVDEAFKILCDKMRSLAK